MKVESHLLCWNELDIMPFVIRHYQKFCDKIIIWDNYSTDGSDKLAKSLGCEVVKFGTKFFDDYENMTIKNNCWKCSDADYVVVADFDECLFSKHEGDSTYMEIYLGLQKGVTIFETIGWQIMSDSMPKEDLTEITNGFRFDNYSKSICFNPKEIKEINYNPGAHRINPVGNVVFSEESLYVLHYKHIGGVQRTIDRYKEYKPRMSRNNRKNGWGKHYDRTEQSIIEEWNERMAKSKPLV